VCVCVCVYLSAYVCTCLQSCRCPFRLLLWVFLLVIVVQEFKTFVEVDVRPVNASTADRLFGLFERKTQGRKKRRVLVNDKLPRSVLSKKVLR
jgi:hypothetical protein